MDISNEYFVRLVDFASLNPTMGELQIRNDAEYAKEMNFASFCTYPQHMELVAKVLEDSDVKPSAVIGFPLGNFPAFTKRSEAQFALAEGAEELDMVINLSSFRDGVYGYIRQEIMQIVEVAHEADALVKVILETCHWNTDQLYMACQLVKEAGADFVKTSTGFAHEGADIMRTYILLQCVEGSGVGVKASGGIKTRAQAEEYIKMGCTRLGIGSAIKGMFNE